MSFQIHPDLTRDGIVVGRFSLCCVLLINDSTYPWFVLVPQREDVRDTVDLLHFEHEMLWKESQVFGAAIMEIFEGDKLNVAALGNITPQLHVHHVVRYETDPAWPSPIWDKGRDRRKFEPYTEEAIQQIRGKLTEAEMEGFFFL